MDRIYALLTEDHAVQRCDYLDMGMDVPSEIPSDTRRVYAFLVESDDGERGWWKVQYSPLVKIAVMTNSLAEDAFAKALEGMDETRIYAGLSLSFDEGDGGITVTCYDALERPIGKAFMTHETRRAFLDIIEHCRAKKIEEVEE